MNTRAIRSTLLSTLGVALALAAGPALAISARITDLGSLGSGFSQPVALNASGQATGTSGTGTGFHPFLWDGTRLQDLGTLGGSRSESVAINDAGQVTGNSNTARDRDVHAFVWNGTTMQDLGTLGGEDSFALAINAAGQVTGWSWTGEFQQHAFLWDRTTLLDLNALIDPADPLQPFVTLTEGIDINDLGQILASGFDSRTNDFHAYLVSPISAPEPGTLALLGLGLMGLVLTRRRRAA